MYGEARVKTIPLVAILLLSILFVGFMVPSAHAQDFTIDIDPASAIVYQGSSANFTVTVAFGAITPPGYVGVAVTEDSGLETVFLGPTNGTSDYTSKLLVRTALSTPPTEYLLVVEGRDDSGNIHGVHAMVTVKAASFRLAIDPPNQNINQGDDVTFEVSVTKDASYKGYVSLDATVVGIPTGISTSIAPSHEYPDFTATLIVSTEPAVSKGVYLVKVTATGADWGNETIIHEVSATVIIVGANFTITIDPPFITIVRGGHATFTVNVTAVGGFSQQVDLREEVLEGFTSSISPRKDIPPFNATLIVYSAPDVPIGEYYVIVEGSGAGQIFQAAATIEVTEADFDVTMSPGEQGVVRGTVAEYDVDVSSTTGFDYEVQLSATVPSDSTAIFTKPKGIPPFTSKLRVVTTQSTATGIHVITVKGSSSGIDNYYTAYLIVEPVNFTITVTPESKPITQGNSSTFLVKVNSTYGPLAGAISLSAEAPTGFTVNIYPSSGTPNFISVMAVSVGLGVEEGTYIIAVEGSGAGVEHHDLITIMVGQSGFTITPSPTQDDIYQSESAQFTVTVNKIGTFSKMVNLTVGAGDELTASIGPNKAEPPYTATLLVGTTLNTPTGDYIIIVEGRADGRLVQTAVILTVEPSDFTIDISGGTSIYQGQMHEWTITIGKTGAFGQSVTLSASAPSGLTASISPSTGRPPFTAKLKVTSSLSTTPGDYTVTVSAIGAGRTHSASVSITVSESKFSLTASPSSAMIYSSQSASFTISVGQDPYFPSTVTLSSSVSGGNLTASLSPTSGVPFFTASLTISTSEGAAAGTYTIAITGTGSTTKSVSVTLTVQEKPPDYEVIVKTRGLTDAYTTVWVDGKDKHVDVNDNSSENFGPFDGLTSHTFKVERETILDNATKFVCDKYTEAISYYEVTESEEEVEFVYEKFYKVTWKTEGLPSGKHVTLDVAGSHYTKASPVSFDAWIEADKQIAFKLVSPTDVTIDNRRYRFSKWVDSAGATITSPKTIGKSDTLTAVYACLDFLVRVYDLPSINVTLDQQTKTVTSNDSVTFVVGAGSHTLQTTSVLSEGKGIAQVFRHFIVPKESNNTETNNPSTISVSKDTEVEVVRKRQILLTLVSHYGRTKGGGWCDEGATANFSVDEWVQISQGIRQLCTGYDGDAVGTTNSGSVVMNGPKTITFRWKQQYLLTVNTTYGTASGQGWYDDRAAPSFSVTAPEGETGVRYIFLGWSGDYTGTETSGTIQMTAPKTISASWKKQHQVSIAFNTAAGTSLTIPPAQAVIINPAGTEEQLTKYTNLWFDEGTYTMTRVMFMGANVVMDKVTYSATAPGTWVVPLHVYTLTVKVVGTMITSGMGGAAVSLTTPDGQRRTETTDSAGEAVFTLPFGTYDKIDVKAQIGSASTSANLQSNMEVTVKVFSTIDAGVIVGLIGLLGTGGLLVFRMRRPSMRRMPPPEEELPPPPPED